MRRLIALALLAIPSIASAQTVYVAPPLPPVPPPPAVYIGPGAIPPHVYIRERIRWRLRRWPRVVVVQAPPPAEYVPAPPQVYAPPPPPPPVYVAPPPPPAVYYAPPPPPVYYAPPPPAPAPEFVVVKPQPVRPGWAARIGLGVRGTGQVVNDGWNNLGIGGEFLYRASPHVVTELAAEYQHSASTPLDRRDIPVTFGVRLHIGRPTWVVSPYFVLAGGVDFASQDLRHTTDDAIYLDGQLGGGLELRLGQHVAITADARFDAKKRADKPADAVVATTAVDGKPVHALGDEVGGQFRLGFAVYF
jgi:hypothetical protein